MDKKGREKISPVWFIVGVALVYILVFGIPGTVKPTSTNNTGVCGIEDTSFTPKMTRFGKAGTALTTAEDYFILTNKIGSQVGGVATTLAVEKDYEVMYGENSTTYYTKVQTTNTDCEDPKFVAVELYMADSSLASKYIENTDGSINALSNNQTMGASETLDMTAYIKTSSDEYFGNPDSTCQNIAVIEYDKTYIQSIKGDNPVGVPGFWKYSNTSKFDGSAAFYIPKSGDGEKVSFNFQITSTTTQPDGTNTPIMYLLDCDIDKDEDTLALINGVEDEDLNMISLANQSLTIYLT